MTDLFGGGQGSLFGNTDDRIPHPKQPDIAPSPDRVRRKLNDALATARAATSMPWSEKETRVWQILFPQMINWLPEDEGRQLLFAFTAEIERLKLAA